MSSGQRMRRCAALVLCLFALTIIGCVEQSIVVKVKKDGSALLHVRSFVMPSPFSGSPKDANGPVGVHKDHVEALIQHLGHGVSVQSNQNASNGRGWSGTELILLCEDVNSLKITSETISLLFNLFNNQPPEKPVVDREPDKADILVAFDFELQDDQLVIEINFEEQSEVQSDKSEEGDRARDPFAGKDSNASLSISSIQAHALSQVRFGFFVETEREITASDATYPVIDHSLIKLYELDGSKLDMNKYSEFVRASPKKPDDIRPWVDKVDGLSVELKSKVHVKLK